MAIKNKKKEKKKNKGPKGKKARAKRQLERQWGEYADDEIVKKSKIRLGKSRLEKIMDRNEESKSSKWNISKKKHVQDDEMEMEQEEVRNTNEDDENVEGGYESSSSSEEEEEYHEAQGAFGNLLSRIQSTPKRSTNSSNRTFTSHEITPNNNMNDIEKEVQEDDSISSTEEEQEEEKQTIDSESEEEDENNSNPPNNSSYSNPYTSHFSTEPFPSEEAANTSIMTTRASTDLISTTHLHPSLEFYMSGKAIAQLEHQEHDTDGDNHVDDDLRCCKRSHHVLSTKLKQHWKVWNKKEARQNKDSSKRNGSSVTARCGFSSLQGTLLPILSSYADVLCMAETRENRESLHNVTLAHILNHVLISRNRVQKHDRNIREVLRQEEETERLEKEAMEEQMDSTKSKKSKKNKQRKTPIVEKVDLASAHMPTETKEHWRDQGFTRPKVLILLPTRGICYRFVEKLNALLGTDSHLENKERFDKEYGPLEPLEQDTQDPKEELRRKQVLGKKGKDWNELFGDDANQDDEFKFGVSFSTKAVKKKKGKKDQPPQNALSMKLYSDFFQSDIIFASPMGLKMMNSKEDTDCDYLSSIEICLVAYSDVLLMQNWDHVNSALDCLNLQPKNLNTTDFSRVRYPLLEGQGAYWRQFIVLSTMSNPHINSTFKFHSKSISGSLKIRRKITLNEAAICNVLMKVKQVFQKIPCKSVMTQDKDRLKYFTKQILPQILRLNQKHTLIYIPSYFDFVTIRNILTESEADFVSITEYSRVSEISRGRARFHQGLKNIMLYTGRAHFYQRHYVKGITHLIFYGLPEHSSFYPEMIHMIRDGGSKGSGFINNSDDMSEHIDTPASCLALFTKYDAHELERVVGTKNCARMIQGLKNTFLFS